MPLGSFRVPTTYYLLPTTYYLLPTTHYPLPTTHYLLVVGSGFLIQHLNVRTLFYKALVDKSLRFCFEDRILL